MKETFAGRIRRAARSFPRGESFTARDLGIAAGIQTRDDNRRMTNTVQDFIRAGEVERVGTGVYRYLWRAEARPQKRRIMWDYFRMRKKCGSPVTVEELRMASGAGDAYTREWLATLSKMGVVKDLGDGRFQLLRDTAEMPESGEKAEKLRALRERRKAEGLRLVGELQGLAERFKALIEEPHDQGEE